MRVESLIERHIPMLQFAHDKHFPLLALSTDPTDLQTLQSRGLQPLDPPKENITSPSRTVSQVRHNKIQNLNCTYTEKSLLKDFQEQYKNEHGLYFPECILV